MSSDKNKQRLDQDDAAQSNTQQYPWACLAADSRVLFNTTENGTSSRRATANFG